MGNINGEQQGQARQEAGLQRTGSERVVSRRQFAAAGGSCRRATSRRQQLAGAPSSPSPHRFVCAVCCTAAGLHRGVPHLHARHRLVVGNLSAGTGQLWELRFRFQLLVLLPIRGTLQVLRLERLLVVASVLRAAGPSRGNPLLQGSWYTLEGRLISAGERGRRFHAACATPPPRQRPSGGLANAAKSCTTPAIPAFLDGPPRFVIFQERVLNRIRRIISAEHVKEGG